MKYKRSFFYRNSLSIIFLSLFVAALFAQAFFGWRDYCSELQEKNAPPITLTAYLYSAHFIEATFENFQSEFLQMSLYVILTIFLRQIGSAESKGLDRKEEVDRMPDSTRPGAPRPVKIGGWRLALYKHSLSIAFGLLFIFSWGMHLYGSYRYYNEQQILDSKPQKHFTEFLSEPVFWFETFQNWQSEFLSVAAIVILSIFLRQKGSPESKPVDAANMETGK